MTSCLETRLRLNTGHDEAEQSRVSADKAGGQEDHIMDQVS